MPKWGSLLCSSCSNRIFQLAGLKWFLNRLPRKRTWLLVWFTQLDYRNNILEKVASHIRIMVHMCYTRQLIEKNPQMGHVIGSIIASFPSIPDRFQQDRHWGCVGVSKTDKKYRQQGCCSSLNHIQINASAKNLSCISSCIRWRRNWWRDATVPVGRWREHVR